MVGHEGSDVALVERSRISLERVLVDVLDVGAEASGVLGCNGGRARNRVLEDDYERLAWTVALRRGRGYVRPRVRERRAESPA
jgi:hypothetical protein